MFYLRLHYIYIKKKLAYFMKNYFLIGFMGSGKTTIGRLLSDKLNLTFIDLDHEIEIKEGKSISEIFSVYGESYFRNLEFEVLKEISRNKNNVISTGGGTFCFRRNSRIIKNNGISIYLESEFEKIMERLTEKEKNQRPLLKDINKAKILFEARKKYYSQADITINTDKSEPDEIIRILAYKFFGKKIKSDEYSVTRRNLHLNSFC